MGVFFGVNPPKNTPPAIFRLSSYYFHIKTFSAHRLKNEMIVTPFFLTGCHFPTASFINLGFYGEGFYQWVPVLKTRQR
jgi:hypothetical protein